MELPGQGRPRPGWLDLTLLALLLAAGAWLVWKIHSGLAYRWDWGAIPQYLLRQDAASGRWRPNLLLQGLLTTVRLSLWATLLALFIGLCFGLLRSSCHPFRRWLGTGYVGAVRNMPPLVLIFIVYFFLSDLLLPLFGIPQLADDPSPATARWMRWLFAEPALFANFVSGVLTLAVLEGAYIAEIVRAGVQSIGCDQWDGAAALGLNRRQQLRHVILPQAFQRILPPLAGQFISTVKDSAIVSVISIQELTFMGLAVMTSTYLALETWITVTALYFLLTFSLSLALQNFEARWRRRLGG